jgi:hypothetical protein
MDMKFMKPYNQRLIPVLKRAIENAKVFNLATDELEKTVSDLQTQELNLFELLINDPV